MAAIGIRQVGGPNAILPARYTVWVQLSQAKEISNKEILKEIKKIILETTIIYVLYSSDIDVIILDKVFKNRIYGLLLTEALKIYKKDYLVEVSSILLSVRVVCKKKLDNMYLAIEIYKALRIVSSSLQITRIRWLHNQTRRTE
jgi:hypothetical protein